MSLIIWPFPSFFLLVGSGEEIVTLSIHFLKEKEHSLPTGGPAPSPDFNRVQSLLLLSLVPFMVLEPEQVQVWLLEEVKGVQV